MIIVFCINQIDNIGGVERVTISKANALSKIRGNSVFIVAGFRRREDDSMKLSDNVKLVDLKIPYWKDYRYKGIKRTWFLFQLRIQHLRKLKKILNQILPDIVISVGGTLFLPHLKISSKPVFIREMHTTKFYSKLESKTLWGKFLYRCVSSFEFNLEFNKYDCISVLTKKDYWENWKDNPKVVVIPNPLLLEIESKVSDLNEKVVISAGRLVESKNFMSLISSWKFVNASNPDWKLKIYGDGPTRSELQKKIDYEGLIDCVELCGHASDIHSKFSHASIFAFTSKSEGFGLVILEAMSHGIPVVSYDCKYGPDDIIDQGKDGFIVPLNDEEGLANKINFLIRDKERRNEMGIKALEKSKMFSMDIIIQKWMSLFSKLLNEKRI